MLKQILLGIICQELRLIKELSHIYLGNKFLLTITRSAGIVQRPIQGARNKTQPKPINKLY